MVTSDTATLIERVEVALRSHPEVLEAYLFGSQARNDANSHSDIDIAVFVTNEALANSGFGIAAELSANLQTGLRRSDVDLVLLNRASPLLYYRILRDGVRVFARDLAATTTREGMALSHYCDYLQQLRIVEQVHRDRVASGRFGQ